MTTIWKISWLNTMAATRRWPWMILHLSSHRCASPTLSSNSTLGSKRGLTVKTLTWCPLWQTLNKQQQRSRFWSTAKPNSAIWKTRRSIHLRSFRATGNLLSALEMLMMSLKLIFLTWRCTGIILEIKASHIPASPLSVRIKLEGFQGNQSCAWWIT